MGNVRSGRTIDAALRKKGFLRDVSTDHIWYIFPNESGEGFASQTKMSHGMMGSTISSKLISDMSHQLHLTKRQFLELVDCSLDEAGYREILRNQGFAA